MATDYEDNIDETEDEIVDCPRGMIAVMDEHGKYIPFLMKVREEDVIWNDEFPKSYRNVMRIPNSVMSFTHPESSWVVNTNPDDNGEQWCIEFTTGGTCTMSKRIWIDSRFDHVYNTNKRMLSYELDLPVVLSGSELERFSIIPTKFFDSDGSISGIMTDAMNYATINCAPIVSYTYAPNGSNVFNLGSSSVDVGNILHNLRTVSDAVKRSYYFVYNNNSNTSQTLSIKNGNLSTLKLSSIPPKTNILLRGEDLNFTINNTNETVIDGDGSLANSKYTLTSTSEFNEFGYEIIGEGSIEEDRTNIPKPFFKKMRIEILSPTEALRSGKEYGDTKAYSLFLTIRGKVFNNT